VRQLPRPVNVTVSDSVNVQSALVHWHLSRRLHHGRLAQTHAADLHTNHKCYFSFTCFNFKWTPDNHSHIQWFSVKVFLLKCTNVLCTVVTATIPQTDVANTLHYHQLLDLTLDGKKTSKLISYFALTVWTHLTQVNTLPSDTNLFYVIWTESNQHRWQTFYTSQLLTYADVHYHTFYGNGNNNSYCMKSVRCAIPVITQVNNKWQTYLQVQVNNKWQVYLQVHCTRYQPGEQ